MIRLSLILCFLISFQATANSWPESCNYFFQSTTEYPSFNRAYNNLLTLDEAVLKGEKSPGWQDFENLKTIINDLQDAKKSMADNGQLDKYQELVAKADEAFKDVEEFKALREAGSSVVLKKYLPSEYELKSLYSKLVKDLNEELPSNLAISTFKMHRNGAMTRLTKNAEKVIPDLVPKFEDLFSKSSGYSSYDEYLKALKKAAKENAKIESMMKLMAEGNHRFAMARPTNARWWIPKVGFHNQHVSGSSLGYNGKAGRNACEATYLSMPVEKYAQWDNDLKPKYGYLEPSPDSGLEPVSVHYGQDIFIFKNKKVEDKITYTLGDSLNRLGDINILWPQGIAAKPEDWSFLFIPWKYKEAMVPVVAGSHEADGVFKPTFINGLKSMPEFKLEKFGQEYIELQYFGHVGLDDVERFEFKSEPPSGEFLEELKVRGIEIYDRRLGKWPPVKWVEGTP